MPTYAFRCAACGRVDEAFLPLRQYIDRPPVFVCCAAPMGRYFAAAPGLGMTSDRHYEGLRATDGTDIGSRAKHRAYMKQHGLTTADDFTQTWAREAQQREQRMAGVDPTRRDDVAEAVQKLGG